jgi:hypothetical protein
MYRDQELKAKIQEYESRLRTEEANYADAIKSRKNYDTLKAIRNDIRDIKEELSALYSIRDRQM